MNYKAFLLPLIVCFLHVQTAPIKRQVTQNQEADNLDVINRALILTHGPALRPDYDLPYFLIGQRVLCYMYDRHTDYYHSLQEALRSDSEYSRDTVEEFILKYTDGQTFTGEISEELAEAASKEYIGREMLSQTCRWVQPRSYTFVAGCSTRQIAHSCARYRLQDKHAEIVTLFDDYARAFGAEGRVVRRLENCEWLSPNSNLPQNITEKIHAIGRVDPTRCNQD